MNTSWVISLETVRVITHQEAILDPSKLFGVSWISVTLQLHRIEETGQVTNSIGRNLWPAPPSDAEPGSSRLSEHRAGSVRTGAPFQLPRGNEA